MLGMSYRGQTKRGAVRLVVDHPLLAKCLNAIHMSPDIHHHRVCANHISLQQYATILLSADALLQFKTLVNISGFLL